MPNRALCCKEKSYDPKNVPTYHGTRTPDTRVQNTLTYFNCMKIESGKDEAFECEFREKLQITRIDDNSI